MRRKTYENLVRRKAKRQGHRLEASGRRDPRAYDFGKYALLIRSGNPAYLVGKEPGAFVHTLEDIEHWLDGV
jgi:hypothetical protein